MKTYSVSGGWLHCLCRNSSTPAARWLLALLGALLTLVGALLAVFQHCLQWLDMGWCRGAVGVSVSNRVPLFERVQADGPSTQQLCRSVAILMCRQYVVLFVRGRTVFRGMRGLVAACSGGCVAA